MHSGSTKGILNSHFNVWVGLKIFPFHAKEYTIKNKRDDKNCKMIPHIKYFNAFSKIPGIVIVCQLRGPSSVELVVLKSHFTMFINLDSLLSLSRLKARIFHAGIVENIIFQLPTSIKAIPIKLTKPAIILNAFTILLSSP